MRTDTMLNTTAKNLLVCIAFLFYLNGCSEGGSGSDGGGAYNSGGNNGNNVISGRIIDIGDEWLYRKGTSALPSDWISVGFDDFTWLTGNTGIGYGDDDDATILSDMQGNYATVYTRKVINYDGSFNINSLALEIDYDDGFVAYINGQEVARANMPVGQPSFDTLASGGREPGTTVLFNLDGFISLIGIGDNVLAIEIHNDSLTSSDLSLLPRLLVNMEELPPLSNNGTALMSWTPPTENTDGSTLGDLAGYKIYYGTSPGSYSNTEIINNPGLTSFLIEKLAIADWYFVMTSFNSSEIESGYSTEVSKKIN